MADACGKIGTHSSFDGARLRLKLERDIVIEIVDRGASAGRGG